MEKNVTPALTKQQQKKALSGKKAQNIFRNVLAVPYETYWPLLQEKEEEFNNTLARLLFPLKKEKVEIPYSEMKGKTWLEIRKAKKALTEMKRISAEEEEKKKPIRRDWTCMGVNAVVRAIEHGTICCAMVAGDTEPKDIIQHLVIMCAIHKVPVLIVPTLRKITRTHMGFPTITMGLKNCVADNEDNHFHQLYLTIKELSAQFPIPEPSTLFHEKFQESIIVKKKDLPKPFIAPCSLYLTRTSTKERAFVPGQVTTPDTRSEGDFLALNSSSTDMEVEDEIDSEKPSVPAGISQYWSRPEQAHKPHYIAPVVKRLQPNPDKKRKNKKKNKK